MAWIRVGRLEGEGQKWTGEPFAEPAESLCISGSKMHVPTLCQAWDAGVDQTCSLPSRNLLPRGI